MSRRQPSQAVGWLVYGVACGSLAGLFAGLYYLVVNDFIREYSRGFAAIILVGAALGLGAGLLADAKLQRNPGLVEWLMFIAFAILLVLFLPTLNAARE